MLPTHKPKQVFPEIKMSPEQKKLADHTVTALLIHANWFAQIMHKTLRWIVTESVPVAATDERSIFVNPDDYFKRSIAHRVFILCHEILHVVLWHCSLGMKWATQGYVLGPDGTQYVYYPKLMNVAMDYGINALLIDCGLEPPPDALFDKNVSMKGMESIVSIYIMLYQDGGFGQGAGGSMGASSGDVGKCKDGRSRVVNEDVLEVGEGSADLMAQETHDDDEKRETEMKMAIAQATMSCKAAGKMPGALNTLIQEMLDPIVEWPDALATVCTRKLGNDAYDWRSVDRRLILRGIGGPRMSEFNCGPVVFVSDSSGSITDPLALRFFAECAGVFEQLRPEKIYFIWCDQIIQASHELEDVDDLRNIMPLGAPGRGGTSFIPPFEWIVDNDIQPDMVIYLTDGYGKFPDPVPWTVVWAMITDVKPPFGEVVRIPPSDNHA